MPSRLKEGCRIHQLHLSRGVRHPPPNKCPRYDTNKFDDDVRVMLELWKMQSTPSLPSLPGLLWPGVVAPNRVLPMGQIELSCLLLLNWIAWNRNILTFKLHTYVNLNCWKWNCFCTLNWIVWNRTILTFKCV